MIHLNTKTLQKVLLLLIVTPLSFQLQASELPDNVSSDGVISIPDKFRLNYVFLGSWFLDFKEQDNKLMQHVYTRKQDAQAYRKTGQWPDGAILIKEQIKTTSSDMGVLLESFADKTNAIFVMVKDCENRFPDNPLWGDGWGWSFFSADDLTRTTTTDYKKDCLGCHEPVRATDLVFTKGYSLLLGN